MKNSRGNLRGFTFAFDTQRKDTLPQSKQRITGKGLKAKHSSPKLALLKTQLMPRSGKKAFQATAAYPFEPYLS